MEKEKVCEKTEGLALSCLKSHHLVHSVNGKRGNSTLFFCHFMLPLHVCNWLLEIERSGHIPFCANVVFMLYFASELTEVTSLSTCGNVKSG